MDALSFFYLQHARVHSSKASSGSSLADRVFGSLTDQQMRVRPAKGLARVEEVAVNPILTTGRQVHAPTWGPQ